MEKGGVDGIVRPAEGVRPEAPELDRLRARERDVADVTVRQWVGRRLDAEAIPLRVAHDSPCLLELADAVRLRRDEPRAHAQQPA